MIILLIDERPEEVTDIKEAIEGPNVEVIYSTFDELPEHPPGAGFWNINSRKYPALRQLTVKDQFHVASSLEFFIVW